MSFKRFETQICPPEKTIAPKMDWPKKIPPAFEKKISQNTIGPIARQVVPHSDEQRFASGFSDDPVGDTDADQGDGVLVKYEGRALMLTTSECAVHCRFCFRKAFSKSRPPVDKAMRKALIRFYPELSKVHLVDYKVRVLDGHDGTQAKVRVHIESGDKQNTWSTVGVSQDIIEASLDALYDSMNYKIYKDNLVSAVHDR